MTIEIKHYFNQLGHKIHSLWQLQNFDEDAFPALVEQQLRQEKVHYKIDKKEITDWVISEKLLPSQTNFNAKFSDLSLTVYTNDKFYIELLFWLDGTTSIHQHAFSGAFTVIEGSSIHSDYSFVKKRQINHALLLGDVQFNNIELLQKGDIRKIIPKQMSAHSLYHLDRPTISLIIRTHGEGYAKPQLSYLKPHIARDPFKRHISITQKNRTLKMLSQLNKDDYIAAYHQHIAKLDLYSHIEIFLNQVYLLSSFGQLDNAIEQFAQKDITIAKYLQPVALNICKEYRINTWRRKIKNPDLKFFLAILLNSPNRQTSLQLIQSKYPNRQPITLIVDWISQLITSEGLDDFDINEDALPFIDSLLQGHTFEQTIEHLAQDYDEDELAQNRPILAQFYQQLKFESVLSSLFLSEHES